jgi:hypothetical protein
VLWSNGGIRPHVERLVAQVATRAQNLSVPGIALSPSQSRCHSHDCIQFLIDRYWCYCKRICPYT